MYLRVVLGALLCAASCSAHAQTYPSRAARMIVPWTAGGTADLLARIGSQKFSESFGHQFVVDNRPGAGGLIGTEQAAKAAPDGHTLLLATTAPNSVAPSLYAKIPFDPVKDFASISLMATTCYVLSVHPSMQVGNTKQLSRLGAEVVSTTPEGLDQFNRAQIALWAKVVKASGAKVE